MPEPISVNQNDKRRRPGFLLEPLGWVQDRLGDAITTTPHLLEPLIEVDHGRMHLMALALAHLPDGVPSDLALKLLQGPKTEILSLTIGHHPIGIDRVLRHLPPKVLAAETYRNLVSLLNDPVTAKFLHHSGSIKETTITGLARLPAALRRPAIMAMFSKIDGIDTFVDGLRYLAFRAGLPFETLATQIGSLNQANQVIAKIYQTVETVPLPATLPPVTIGDFNRIDCVTEIRGLAERWRNCLAEYLHNINDGTSAIYLSENYQAVCFLCRHGRLGWFVVQIKGPKNVDLNPDQLAEIQNTFAAAGLPESSMIEAVNGIVMTHRWSHPRLEPDPDEAFDDVALY